MVIDVDPYVEFTSRIISLMERIIGEERDNIEKAASIIATTITENGLSICIRHWPLHDDGVRDVLQSGRIDQGLPNSRHIALIAKWRC